MTAKTMAEVLAEHSDYLWRTATGWECVCGHVISFTTAGALVSFTNHQAAALSAAGFGLVADAGAKALEDAAEAIEAQRDATNPDREPDEGWSVIDHRAGRFLGKTVAARLLRARAAAVRGEG